MEDKSDRSTVSTAARLNFKYKTINFKSKILHDILKSRGECN